MIQGYKVKGGKGRWMNWSNGEGFLEWSYWKGLELAFAKMRIFRILNPRNSHWCLQSVLWSNYFGEIQIKTKTCFTTSGFWLLWDVMFMEIAQKKVTVCRVGLAWASGLHGILALLPFSSDTFQQSITEGLCRCYEVPPFPASSSYSQAMK